jgi:hypothetical protein
MAQKTEISLFQRLLQAPKDLSAGVTYPLEALLLLVRSPRLLSLVIMPIGVNTVLGVLLYLGVLVPGWQFIAQLSTGLPAGTAAWVATLSPWLSQVLGWIPAGVEFLDDILQGILAIALFILLGLGAIWRDRRSALAQQSGGTGGTSPHGSVARQHHEFGPCSQGCLASDRLSGEKAVTAGDRGPFPVVV